MAFRYFIIIGLLIYIAYTMKKDRERQERVEDRVRDIQDKMEDASPIMGS